MMHIKKSDTIPNSLGDFHAFCGVRVSGLTRSYLTVDDALKAIRAKVGAWPCQDCLRAVREEITAVS